MGMRTSLCEQLLYMLQYVLRVGTFEDKALVFYYTSPPTPMVSYGMGATHPDADTHLLADDSDFE